MVFAVLAVFTVYPGHVGASAGLKELVQHHKFVGCASASISLVQFQVSIFFLALALHDGPWISLMQSLASVRQSCIF
jgi:hypothetical protein